MGWLCGQCTYLNEDETRTKCEMCNARRASTPPAPLSEPHRQPPAANPTGSRRRKTRPEPGCTTRAGRPLASCTARDGTSYCKKHSNPTKAANPDWSFAASRGEDPDEAEKREESGLRWFRPPGYKQAFPVLAHKQASGNMYMKYVGFNQFDEFATKALNGRFFSWEIGLRHRFHKERNADVQQAVSEVRRRWPKVLQSESAKGKGEKRQKSGGNGGSGGGGGSNGGAETEAAIETSKKRSRTDGGFDDARTRAGVEVSKKEEQQSKQETPAPSEEKVASSSAFVLGEYLIHEYPTQEAARGALRMIKAEECKVEAEPHSAKRADHKEAQGYTLSS